MKQRFYKLWWFWLITISTVLFIGNVIVLICLKGDSQSAWLTLISGWVSGISTIVLGIIAVWQNSKYKQENDSFLKEQNDFAWKNNYAEMYKRFLNQLNANWAEIKKSSPQKLKVLFLDKLRNNSYNEYDVINSEYSGTFVSFIVTLRSCFIINELHRKLYDKVILFNYSIHTLMAYFDSVSSNEVIFNSEICNKYVEDATSKYNNLYDAVHTYEQKINLYLFEIYDMEISVLKDSAEVQREEHKKWYDKVKNISAYTENLVKNN